MKWIQLESDPYISRRKSDLNLCPGQNVFLFIGLGTLIDYNK